MGAPGNRLQAPGWRRLAVAAAVAVTALLVTGCGPKGGRGGGHRFDGPVAVAKASGATLPEGVAPPGAVLTVRAEPGLDARYVSRAMEAATAKGWRRFRLAVGDADPATAPELTFEAMSDAPASGSEPGEAAPAPVPPPAGVLEGERDVASLRAVVAGASDAVHACYERALARAPWIGGRLIVRLEIAPDGAVADASIAVRPKDSEAMDACVLAVCGSLRFPAAADSTTVDAPFDLIPSGHEAVPVAVVVGPRTISATDPVGETHGHHTDERDLTWEEMKAVLLAATDAPIPPPGADVLPRAGLKAERLDRVLRALAPRVRALRIVVTPTTR